MIEGWKVVALALGYVGLLFTVAWVGDRKVRLRTTGVGRPLTYALSLAVYCTSWTFFGSVGLAAATGYDFIPVYLGPMLMFMVGAPLIVRIVRLAKSQNITSIADFLAARYGKSPTVAAVATVIAVSGCLPYIALQLKAAATSVEILLGPNPFHELTGTSTIGVDLALVIALALAAFAVLFGTRHIDATEHQDGLMLAIAAESIVKLAAFLAVGIFVVFILFGGARPFFDRVWENTDIQTLFGRGLNGSSWLTVTFLSLVCIVLLPRQFHVTVVENNAEAEIRRASRLFPLYLVAINIFVLPIAAAGLTVLPDYNVSSDMYVLALPMWADAHVMTMVVFIGGLSAATAMVIVDSVALAIMICNGLVVPWLLSRRFDSAAPHDELAGMLLLIRRVAIFAVIILGYLVYRALGQVHGLAAIGLLSFAAVAQLAPAFFGGLVWRRATASGAIAGILAGFGTWAYTLLLPWVVRAGWLPSDLLTDGPLGLGFLKPQALFYLQFEPLTHGVLLSLMANVGAYVVVSLLRAPEPIERMQASIFVAEDMPRPVPASAFRLWRTAVTVADLKHTVGRYLGAERAERSFAEFEAGKGSPLRPDAEADIGILRFTEHLLSSAIGAASARLVLSLLLRRSNLSSQGALKLLDDATEAIQYNRDLLQSALDQVRHGLSVFDRDMRLICWNRQYRELLDIPAELGRIGVPLDSILRTCAERGDYGRGSVDQIVRDRLRKLAVTRETFREQLADGRILEIRTSPVPQGGIVTTYLDVTDQVSASDALARANETLERRVSERTNELVQVNAALSIAKVKADEANRDKTRFLAAASHDLLQPLNAARLYASSLMERPLGSEDERLARNVDKSLEAVEEILAALLDISRLDSGQLTPEWRNVDLAELMRQLHVEFEPMARAKGLDLRLVATSLWVRTDRRLLRRVLQNLLSNAIKYTAQGVVLFGVLRRGGRVIIHVCDTGPGIEPAQQALIFKEFHRLPQAMVERGLGLGLSIVERIARVIDAPIGVRSRLGRGSTFSLSLERGAVEPQVVTGQVAPPRAAGDISGLVALCVDNDVDVLNGMRALFEGWGCEALLARDAGEAVAHIGRARAQPAVIFADYHLDHGTGTEAVRMIRLAAGWEIPAVIASADHSPEVQAEVRALGLMQLRKPLKAAVVRSILAQVALHRRAAAE